MMVSSGLTLIMVSFFVEQAYVNATTPALYCSVAYKYLITALCSVETRMTD